MGVDYVVDLACPVKQDLSTKGLIAHVKDRNIARTMLAHARGKGDSRDPARMEEIGRARTTPEGTTIESVSLQALQESGDRLQPYEHQCATCPANVLRSPFGCYGYLPYPIPGAVEAWLMARLPENLDTPIGRLLRDAVVDLGYDGETTRDMRRAGIFFQRSSAVTRSWPMGFLRRWTLTSDQILQMLIGLGDLEPSHCRMVFLFLGRTSHGNLPATIDGPEERLQALRQLRIGPEEGEAEVRAWISLLNALATAAILQVKLLIDA
jgi:hypothetical protein